MSAIFAATSAVSCPERTVLRGVRIVPCIDLLRRPSAYTPPAPPDSMRFHANRLNEVGLLKMTANESVTKALDLGFSRQLQSEIMR
ncbi:MAG: hypothetical protein E6H91_09675 [Chloroflexi bacterium]|nr:MAG: hypothetical protein E6H91_09675 [Chloroflexota bacterium]